MSVLDFWLPFSKIYLMSQQTTVHAGVGSACSPHPVHNEMHSHEYVEIKNGFQKLFQDCPRIAQEVNVFTFSLIILLPSAKGMDLVLKA